MENYLSMLADNKTCTESSTFWTGIISKAESQYHDILFHYRAIS